MATRSTRNADEGGTDTAQPWIRESLWLRLPQAWIPVLSPERADEPMRLIVDLLLTQGRSGTMVQAIPTRASSDAKNGETSNN